MKYIYTIKTSSTWVCPKAGRWKVICVGGGASAGWLSDTENVNSVSSVAGKTTSFGSYLSASGGVSTKEPSGARESWGYGSGYGGYNGLTYGGTPGTGCGNVTTGAVISSSLIANTTPTAALGYGAGGGYVFRLSSQYGAGISGRAGDLETTIVDIEEGESVSCTIGTGGAASHSITNLQLAAGAKGVIIVQYLGA